MQVNINSRSTSSGAPPPWFHCSHTCRVFTRATHRSIPEAPFTFHEGSRPASYAPETTEIEITGHGFHVSLFYINLHARRPPGSSRVSDTLNRSLWKLFRNFPVSCLCAVHRPVRRSYQFTMSDYRLWAMVERRARQMDLSL